MKKILFFLQYDELGSSSMYRVLIYKKLFEKDYDVKYTEFWNNKYVKKYMINKKKYCIQIAMQYVINVIKRYYYLLLIAPKYDIIFIQRCFIPYLPPYFLKLLSSRVDIVYDIDDALHLSKQYYCDKIANVATSIIVGNKELEKYYSRISKKVYLIPTVDNNLNYTPYVTDTFENKCIGWIGSKSQVGNLKIISKAINNIVKKHPEVYLKVIVDDTCGLEKEINNFKFIKWDKETYIKEMAEFSIGIMPLIDNEFNKGKCGFKLVQYLDLQKPVLATDLGENKYIVGKYGMLCNSSDWEENLKKLLFDKELYGNCIKQINKNFLKDYGYVETYNKIVGVLEKREKCR